ncbi:MAG: hypothetical protein KF901_20620 [Myxococcales bacterium]|nr:hypothetical protein [Myxococcales bacterium]
MTHAPDPRLPERPSPKGVNGDDAPDGVNPRVSHPSGRSELIFTGTSLVDGAHLVGRLHRQLQVLETSVPDVLVPELGTVRCDLAVVAYGPRTDAPQRGAPWLATTVSHALAERMSLEEWDPARIATILPELRDHLHHAVVSARARDGVEAAEGDAWAAVVVVSSQGLLLGEGQVSTLALTRGGETRRVASKDGMVEQRFDPRALHAALLVVGPGVGRLSETLLRSHLEREAPPDDRLSGMRNALEAGGVNRGGLLGAFFP